MKVLWAPWRMAYIKNARKPAACIFCVKPRERRDAANLLLHRGRHGLVMMNLFPYNSGHLLIAPYLHVRSLEQLPDEVSLDLMKLIQLSLRVLRAEMKPEGFNIGLNLGRVAGAGIERHVHFHIVPRWNGDTNFMPLFGEVRVMPEYLETTYRKLKTRFEAPAAPGKKRTRR
jgi:ATP adenylyltransferase